MPPSLGIASSGAVGRVHHNQHVRPLDQRVEKRHTGVGEDFPDLQIELREVDLANAPVGPLRRVAVALAAIDANLVASVGQAGPDLGGCRFESAIEPGNAPAAGQRYPHLFFRLEALR